MGVDAITTAERPRLALIILDGLGDRPHPATGNLSPVEAARTPNLDRLAAGGALGTVTVIGPGVAPESDAGVLALLGYDPVADSPGRGVLEALGVGIPLEPGDVAFRLNFATIDGDRDVIDSRVGRSLRTDEARALSQSLNRGDLLHDRHVRAEVIPTVGHRGVLWLRPTDGNALSAAVSNSDPFYEKVGGMGQARAATNPRALDVVPLDGSTAAARTADATNRFLELVGGVLAGDPVNARRAMSGKPVANGLLLRNAGSVSGAGHPQSFAEKHGMPGAAVTEMPVERGIARLLGLTDLYVGPMGPDRDTALRERAGKTREAMERSPFVYVHLKGPDEPGHDGRADLKRDIVEQLDRSYFGPFLDGLDLENVRLAVTADHATPCVLRGHADDPVPLLLAGQGVGSSPPGDPVGKSAKFSERAAQNGSLGSRRGSEVLDLLLDPSRAPR